MENILAEYLIAGWLWTANHVVDNLFVPLLNLAMLNTLGLFINTSSTIASNVTNWVIIPNLPSVYNYLLLARDIADQVLDVFGTIEEIYNGRLSWIPFFQDWLYYSPTPEEIKEPVKAAKNSFKEYIYLYVTIDGGDSKSTIKDFMLNTLFGPGSAFDFLRSTTYILKWEIVDMPTITESGIINSTYNSKIYSIYSAILDQMNIIEAELMAQQINFNLPFEFNAILNTIFHLMITKPLITYFIFPLTLQVTFVTWIFFHLIVPVTELSTGFVDPASSVMEGIINLHLFIGIFLTGVFVFVITLCYRNWINFSRAFYAFKNRIRIIDENISIALAKHLAISRTYNDPVDPDNSIKKFHSLMHRDFAKRIVWEIEYLKCLDSHKFIHSTFLELVWTALPSLILFIVSIPSFILLYSMDEIVTPAVTIKAIGHQWYWSYELSDYQNEIGTVKLDSYITPDEDLKIGDIRLLTVNNEITFPTRTHIRVLVTSTDVLHAWAVPSLGIKVDAVPGRLNQVPVYIKRSGIFYGQCSELCGVNHGFMPIVIRAVDLLYYIHLLFENAPNLITDSSVLSKSKERKVINLPFIEGEHKANLIYIDDYPNIKNNTNKDVSSSDENTNIDIELNKQNELNDEDSKKVEEPDNITNSTINFDPNNISNANGGMNSLGTSEVFTNTDNNDKNIRIDPNIQTLQTITGKEAMNIMRLYEEKDKYLISEIKRLSKNCCSILKTKAGIVNNEWTPSDYERMGMGKYSFVIQKQRKALLYYSIYIKSIETAPYYIIQVDTEDGMGITFISNIRDMMDPPLRSKNCCCPLCEIPTLPLPIRPMEHAKVVNVNFTYNTDQIAAAGDLNIHNVTNKPLKTSILDILTKKEFSWDNDSLVKLILIKDFDYIQNLLSNTKIPPVFMVPIWDTAFMDNLWYLYDSKLISYENYLRLFKIYVTEHDLRKEEIAKALAGTGKQHPFPKSIYYKRHNPPGIQDKTKWKYFNRFWIDIDANNKPLYIIRNEAKKTTAISSCYEKLPTAEEWQTLKWKSKKPIFYERSRHYDWDDKKYWRVKRGITWGSTYNPLKDSPINHTDFTYYWKKIMIKNLGSYYYFNRNWISKQQFNLRFKECYIELQKRREQSIEKAHSLEQMLKNSKKNAAVIRRMSTMIAEIKYKHFMSIYLKYLVLRKEQIMPHLDMPLEDCFYRRKNNLSFFEHFRLTTYQYWFLSMKGWPIGEKSTPGWTLKENYGHYVWGKRKYLSVFFQVKTETARVFKTTFIKHYKYHNKMIWWSRAWNYSLWRVRRRHGEARVLKKILPYSEAFYKWHKYWQRGGKLNNPVMMEYFKKIVWYSFYHVMEDTSWVKRMTGEYFEPPTFFGWKFGYDPARELDRNYMSFWTWKDRMIVLRSMLVREKTVQGHRLNMRLMERYYTNVYNKTGNYRNYCFRMRARLFYDYWLESPKNSLIQMFRLNQQHPSKPSSLQMFVPLKPRSGTRGWKLHYHNKHIWIVQETYRRARARDFTRNTMFNRHVRAWPGHPRENRYDNFYFE